MLLNFAGLTPDDSAYLEPNRTTTVSFATGPRTVVELSVDPDSRTFAVKGSPTAPLVDVTLFFSHAAAWQRAVAFVATNDLRPSELAAWPNSQRRSTAKVEPVMGRMSRMAPAIDIIETDPN